MLDQDEFKSIWEIAFRWEEMEPPEGDQATLPKEVIKNIERLIWAFRRDRIVLRHSSGIPVTKNDIIDMLFIDWTIIRLNRCLKKKEFPYSFLSERFTHRAEILKWCEDDYIKPPEFWIGGFRNTVNGINETHVSSSIAPEQEALLATLVKGANRHRNSKFDSMICQAIARTLWDEHPYMSIEDMKKHKAIQIYGNGRAYVGKNTLQDWLRPVDPRPQENKTGKNRKKILE